MNAPVSRAFTHLLVCVDVHNEDGLLLAHPLIERARAFAGAARVTVLSVVPPVATPATPWGAETAAIQAMTKAAQTSNDAARRALNTLVERLRDGRSDAGEVDGRLFERDGDVADNIVEVCGHVGADAIVLASHSRHGLAHRVLGSVAERTASKATVPVIIVPRVALG